MFSQTSKLLILPFRGVGQKYPISFCHRQVPQTRFELKDAREANKEYGLGSTTPDDRAEQAWTDQEVNAMKVKVIEMERPEIARIIEASRATGMRLDEVASLRRHEAENALKTGILHLTNTNGGRPRAVPLSERASKIFRVVLENHSSKSQTLRYIGITEEQKKDVYLQSNFKKRGNGKEKHMRGIGFTGTEMPKDIIREKLLIVFKEYKITLDTLNKVTGIAINWLSDYINGKKEIDDLPIERYGSLFEITIFLSEGIKMISEDERIKGVIDVLVQIFGLKYETISLYAGLEKKDIEDFMRDTTLINYEKKYKLATASMILHYLFKNPNYPVGNN